MALAQQALELARVGVVLVDVEAERERVADAEHAERAVVGPRELPLRSPVALGVVIDRPRVVPAERLRVHRLRLVRQRQVAPEEEDVFRERARVDGRVGLEDLERRLDGVALPRRALEPFRRARETRALVEKAAADVLDARQETRKHEDAGDELEDEAGLPSDAPAGATLRSQHAAHAHPAGAAAARRTAGSLTRRSRPKRSAIT